MKPILISLGPDCISAFALHNAGLRDQAFPFDWNLTPMDAIIKIFADDFQHVCALDHLKVDPDNSSKIRDDYYGITFVHDFVNPINIKKDDVEADYSEQQVTADWSSMVPIVKEKYRRRYDRMIAIIGSGRPVYFLRYGHCNPDQAQHLYNLIKSKYPQSNVFIIVASDHSEKITDQIEYCEFQTHGIHNNPESWKQIFQRFGLMN